MRFAHVADYAINLEESGVQWTLADPTDADTRDSAVHLARNQVVPMFLSNQEVLVLHASAVVLPSNEVIAFSGPSEIGKSTLASAFHKSRRARRLADDWITILPHESQPLAFAHQDGVEAAIASPLPSSPISLDGIETEYAFDLPLLKPYESQRYPLSRIYLLEHAPKDAPIEIVPITPKSRYVSLARNLFRLDSASHHHLKKEFRLLSAFLEEISVYALRYPRRREQLPDLIDRLLTHQS